MKAVEATGTQTEIAAPVAGYEPEAEENFAWAEGPGEDEELLDAYSQAVLWRHGTPPRLTVN